MRMHSVFVFIGILPFLVSCAVQPLALGPVGPGPYARRASSTDNGELEVFTETEEYYEDQSSYFPHTDYQIYTVDGKRLKRVWNHQTHEDEAPAIVTLAPGQYVVRAWAEFYGLVSVPVEIKANKVTRVILQPGWAPRGTQAKTELVQIPGGYFVGWSAGQLKSQ